MCVDARGLFKFWWIYQTCPVFVLIFGPAAKFVGSQFPNQGWNMGACSGSAESQPLVPHVQYLETHKREDLPGRPVIKMSPSSVGVQVPFLVRERRSDMPQDQKY